MGKSPEEKKATNKDEWYQVINAMLIDQKRPFLFCLRCIVHRFIIKVCITKYILFIQWSIYITCPVICSLYIHSKGAPCRWSENILLWHIVHGNRDTQHGS